MRKMSIASKLSNVSPIMLRLTLGPLWIAAPRSAAELTQAVRLAEQSLACVQDLKQSPLQQGNAIWLIGTFLPRDK
jgi:hypothetical protein